MGNHTTIMFEPALFYDSRGKIIVKSPDLLLIITSDHTLLLTGEIRKVTTLDSSTKEIIHCQTDHLTSFAILMSSTPLAEIHEEILNVITYLGCSLSIIGLILSLVGLSVFRFVVRSFYSSLKHFSRLSPITVQENDIFSNWSIVLNGSSDGFNILTDENNRLILARLLSYTIYPNYNSLRVIRKPMATKVHINMSAALLLANVTFMVGIDEVRIIFSYFSVHFCCWSLL